MVGFSFTINDERVTKTISRLTSGSRAEKLTRIALGDIGRVHTEIVKRLQFGPYKSTPYANKLRIRSGFLRNRVDWQVRGTRFDGLRMAMFVDAEYAAIQEDGGTVTPKGGQFLRVPTRRALTPSGNVKGSAQIVRSGSGWSTADGEKTFIWRSAGGRLFIGIDSPRFTLPDGRPMAVWALKRSVKIKGRLGFAKTFRRRTRKFANRRIGRLGDEMVKGAVSG